MVRIGFWGTGSATGVADWHAAAFLQDKRANLTAVYNRTPARSERWAARYSRDIRVCRSEEELLESCDAVVICTPNYLHREQAKEALAAGRHVLLEKPLACSESEAQNLQDTARRNRVFGAVGYVYRFAGPVIRMRQILQEEFGSLYTVTARLGGIRLANPQIPMEWRMRREYALAGALYDMGSHLIDTAAFAADEKLTSVFCRTQTCIRSRPGTAGTEQVETDDAAVLIGQSEQALYSLLASRTGPGAMQMTVSGDGGTLELHIGSEIPLRFWKKHRQGGYSAEGMCTVISGRSQQQEWFCRQASAFLDGIEGKSAAMAGFAESGYVDRVLRAAMRSAESGQLENV